MRITIESQGSMKNFICEVGKQMNKLYYFHGPDDEGGVFVGAKTWREARNMAIGHDSISECEFIAIQGRLCKDDGKPVYTKVTGEHEAHELLAAGYTNFWWSGDCEKCGRWEERLNPDSGKLICSDCEEEE